MAHASLSRYSLCPPPRSPVNDVTFHPDGLCVAACSSDHTIKIWDIRMNQLLQHYAAHQDSVNRSKDVFCVRVRVLMCVHKHAARLDAACRLHVPRVTCGVPLPPLHGKPPQRLCLCMFSACAHAHANMCVCISLSPSLSIYTCMHACMHTYIHTHIHTYILTPVIKCGHVHRGLGHFRLVLADH